MTTSMPEYFGAILSNSYRSSYGTMFISNANIEINIASTGVYENITGFNPGTLIEWQFSSDRLTCQKSGVYLILWTITLKADQNNSEVSGAVKNVTTVFPTTRASATLDKDAVITLTGFGVGQSNVGDVGMLGITGKSGDKYFILDAKLTLIRLDS